MKIVSKYNVDKILIVNDIDSTEDIEIEIHDKSIGTREFFFLTKETSIQLIEFLNQQINK